MWNNRVHKIYPSSEKTLSHTLQYDLYSNVSEDGHNFRVRLDFLAFRYAFCIYISISSLVTFHPCGNDIQLLDATTDEDHWLLHGSCPFFQIFYRTLPSVIFSMGNGQILPKISTNSPQVWKMYNINFPLNFSIDSLHTCKFRNSRNPSNSPSSSYFSQNSPQFFRPISPSVENCALIE